MVAASLRTHLIPGVAHVRSRLEPVDGGEHDLARVRDNLRAVAPCAVTAAKLDAAVVRLDAPAQVDMGFGNWQMLVCTPSSVGWRCDTTQ